MSADLSSGSDAGGGSVVPLPSPAAEPIVASVDLTSSAAGDAAQAEASPDPLSPNSAALKAARDLQRERKKSMVMVDGWIDVQEKTFLRWVNFQLSKRQLKLANLKDGLSDGVLLCALVEILSKRALPARPNRVGKSQIVHLDNLRIAFDFLASQKGVHLVNIGAADVEAGNLKIILGLIWGLIQKYQIMEGSKPAPVAAEKKDSLSVESLMSPSSAPAPSPQQTPSTQESTVKSDLLKWVNEQVAPFNVGSATDFTKSWQDGRILTALVESLDKDSNKQLSLAGEATEIVQAALTKAENSYAIPPLMDAADIVTRPQEHSLMTYISLFREVCNERIAAEKRAVEDAALRAAAAAAAAAQAERAALEANASEATAAAAFALPMSPLNADISEDMEALTLPLSPRHIVDVEEQPAAGAIADDDDAGAGAAPAESKDQQEENLSEADLAAMSARTRTETHPALVGAYIDSSSLAAASGESGGEPYDSEAQAKKDALDAPLDIERRTGEVDLPPSAAAAASSAGADRDEHGAKPDPNAHEDYSAPEEDAEGRLPGESLQDSIDRRIEKLMNAIEICVVTPDHKYLQSDMNGVIVDGAGGWKFLRDFQSRYLGVDPDGRVYTCKKKPECRFRIIRGTTQYFVDSHGHYLSVLAGGVVRGETHKTDQAKFKICFPVVEGVLSKKGTTGLQRWQERYFAFNGNVMSYWRQKKEVGKERPNGIYHPARMQSVNINRQVAKRFNIVFQDGKIVELLAPTVEEAIRWVRGLNSRGIKTVQQTKRMSVVANTGTPSKGAQGAPVASPAK